MDWKPRHVVSGVLVCALVACIGCPYFGPITPTELDTSFDPVINIITPSQTEGLSYDQSQGTVFFEVFVTDEDNEAADLMFFWVLNDQKVHDGLNQREFQLQLTGAGVEASNRLVIQVVDPRGNEAEKQWLFDVQ